MLKELLKNKEFLKIIKKSLERPEIIDIVLFGSLIRGKEKPEDIDLLIIYSPQTKNYIEIGYSLRKSLEKIDKKISIIEKKYDKNFVSDFFAREAILSEGFSLRQEKFVSELFGYRNYILFRYSLKNMNKTRRMQFYYGLYGRNKERGLLEKNKSYKFSERIIISEVETSETIKSFFERWKIDYLEIPVIIPERIAKYRIK